jgi:hypothetical protein
MAWILKSDKLPEKNTPILLTIDMGCGKDWRFVAIGQLTDDPWYPWRWYDVMDYDEEDLDTTFEYILSGWEVVAWQPLPKVCNRKIEEE